MVSSVVCALPCCHNDQRLETALSLGLRVTAVFLGVIAVIVGIGILHHVLNIDPLSAKFGWIPCAFGGLLIVGSLFVKSVLILEDHAQNPTMATLVEEGKVEEAWRLYVLKCYEEVNHEKPNSNVQHIYLTETNWRSFPPEFLLLAIIDHWKSEGINLLDQVSPGFIRNCAIRYKRFCRQCFIDDQLWNCFKGYPDYIADIAAAHPIFGFRVMTSKRGADMIGDGHRIEVFRSSYQFLIQQINQHGLDEEQVKSLANFLIGYPLVIDRADFKRILQVRATLLLKRDQYAVESEEYKDYSLYGTLMDLVEGKLSFQGIFGGKRCSTYFPPVDTDLMGGVFDYNWIEEIARRVADTNVEEEIRKGLLYLSLIPDSSPYYIDAQLMLGHVWMDVENFHEAGHCFLRIAKLRSENMLDALMLASTNLLAVLQEGKNSMMVLREDTEKLIAGGKSVRLLNLKEAKSLTVEQLIQALEELQI